MKERIEQIIDQAYCDLHKQNPNRFFGQRTIAKKVAELIVRECLAQVDKVDVMLEDDKEKTGVAWVGYAIEKHFGVEE